MAGFGGQGVLLIGTLVAQAAIEAGLNTTFMPAYGVEMRGGTANCTVVVSDDEIGSPVISAPMAGIMFTLAALEKFEQKLKPSALLIANSDMINRDAIKRKDLKVVYIPFNSTAKEVGNPRAANMVALGAFLAKTGVVQIEGVEKAMRSVLAEKNHRFIPANIKAVQKGMELAK